MYPLHYIMGIEAASEEKQSEFNSAIATLKRIDVIKKGLIESTLSKNIDTQWLFLKAYYKELVSVMDDKDDKAQRMKFMHTRKAYNEYRNAVRMKKPFIPINILDAIDDWEVELKNIEQRYGMNMPKKADPRFAMAGRGKYR